MHLTEGIRAASEVEASTEGSGWCRRDVVDDTAYGVWPEQDLPRALQDLDTFEALDRGVVVGGVVAVGAVSQR